MQTRRTANQSKRWMSLGVGFGLALALLVFCYFAFVMANEQEPPTEAVAAEVAAPVYGLLDVTSTPAAAMEQPTTEREVVAPVATAVEAEASAVVSAPVATPEPTLPVNILSQDTDNLPFVPDVVLEQARNQVQTTAEGVPFVEQTAHRAEFAAGGLAFTALPETAGTSAQGDEEATPDLAVSPDIAVQLASITIGTTTLADKQTAPTAAIENNVVRYDRGQGVVEEFIARDAGVEQRWWLEEKPAQAGDLTLVVEVETALTLATTGEGFIFQALDQTAGQMVPVIRYARPQAVDANQQTLWGQTDSRLVATDETGMNRYELTLSFPADWLATAQYPVLIDPLISGLLPLEQGSPAQNQENVQIAYNPDDNEFLLVWQDKRNGNNYDIYGQRLDGDGALLDDNFTINTASYNQDMPQVAYAPGGGKYLVTWRHYTSALQNDLYGQFLSGNGQLSGSAFAITTGPASTLQKPTDIIYNSQSSQFLVLWEDSRTTYTNIWGKHVSLSGSLGSEIQITTATTNNQSLAAGAYNGNNQQYLVVWATGDNKIYGRRLTAGGVVTATDSILLANNFGVTAPDVTYVASTGQYLAVWQDNRNSGTNGSDIYAQRIAPDGTLTGSNSVVSAHTAGETSPRLALSADGGTWVVWQRNNGVTTGQDLSAQELDGTGQLVGSLVTVYQDNTPGADPTDQERPVIALNTLGDIVFAWQDKRKRNYDVYARLRLDNGNIGGDFLTHPATGNQENVRITFNTTANEYLVVWQDFRNDLLGWQIYGQRVSGSGALIGDNMVINSAGTEPDVAYSSASNEYLVVWNYNNTIMGQRVAANGGLSGSAYLVIPGLSKGTLADQPAVVYNPTTNLFLVALRVRVPGISTVHKIIARQTPGIYSNVEVVSLTNIAVAEPDVAIASDGSYLVVWQDPRNGTYDIYGRRLTSAGAYNGSDFGIRTTGTTEGWQEMSPDVAWNSTASTFLVAWESYFMGTPPSQLSLIEGQRVNTSGTLVGAVLTLDATDGAAGDVDYVSNPNVTASDGKWLIVWQDARSASTLVDIKARTVQADGLLLGGQTIPLMVTAGEQRAPVIVAGNLDYALLAWQDNREGSWDLYAALYQMDVAVAGLTAMNNSPTVLGNSTQLTATITAGTNVVYTWNFGDNTTGSGATPNHTYAQPGVYTAIVTATNSDNLLTASTVVTIYQAAVADFTATPVSGTVPLTVTFTNSSTFATSYFWQFGDGATSTAISPTHVYTQAGVYTVTLSASNLYSSDTLTRSAYITVYDNNPSAIIVKEGPAIVEAGEPITYTLTVTNNGFYDLSNLVITDTLPAGAIYISGGTLVGQTVRWTFSSLAAGNSLSVSFVITANSLVINDRYAVKANGGLLATGAPVITVIGEPWGGYWWDDTFFYRRPLTLTTGNVITSGPGITNTVAFTIATSTLISEGKLQIDGDDMRVLYRDVLGWHLLPTQISRVVSPTAVITFPLAGELPDAEGTYWLYYGNALAGPGPELEAPDVTAGQVITSVTGTGTVTPTVSFFADPRLAWVGQSIRFTHYVTPVAVIETFTWNFGDGITNTISNTTHAYTTPGVYTVTLTVTTTEGLAVTYGYTNYITILADQSGVVTITVGNEEEPVVITNLTAGQPGEAQSAMGDFFVSFPAGAITQTLIITHTPFQAEVQQNTGVMKQFALDAAATTGQAVTQFGQPLQLVLDLTAWNMTPAEMATVVFFYWDETEAEWVALPTTVDTAHGVALATTDHFSDFAAASNYGLGGAPALRRLPSVSEGGVDLLTGSATYIYPLEVPPGTHGVQPNLSLVYNSGAADTLLDQQAGIVGHGFELAGLGWIQYDEKSEEYYLNLNGVSERLIPETANPSIFHTEHETFWRIELLTGGENGVGDALYWLVTIQDGTQYRFGFKPDSATYFQQTNPDVAPQVYRFGLDQVSDIYGNTMSIRYEEREATHSHVYMTQKTYETASWPVAITYTQNTSVGLEATRLITFTYGQPGTVNEQEIRADMPSNKDIGPGQRYGYPTVLTRMSAWVDLDGAGSAPFSLVRTYVFSYTYLTQKGLSPSSFGPDHYHLMLTSITEMGADNATLLPTTVLTYTETGHLDAITNGYGGTVAYAYEKIEVGSPVMYGYYQGGEQYNEEADDPDTDRWRVSQRTIINDGQEVGIFRYRYGMALFRDKDFRGHQDVTVILPTENRVVTEFSLGALNTSRNVNRIYADERLWGRPYRTTVQNQYQDVLSTVTTDYQYLSQSAMPQCVRTITGNAPLVQVCYEYDSYGNLARVEQLGDGAITADDRVTIMTYEPPLGERYVSNRLSTTAVEVDGLEVARTVYEYTIPDPDTQAVTLVKVTQVDLVYGESLIHYTSFGQAGNPSGTWTDMNVDYTSISYDEIHQTFPVVTTYPEGLEESRRYDARFGVTTAITDVNGLVIQYTYDTFGRVMAETNNAQGPVSYDYLPGNSGNGLQILVTNHGGTPVGDDQLTWYTYNGLGQLVHTEVIAGDAIHTDYDYDGLGQLVMTTVPYTGTQPLRDWILFLERDDEYAPVTLYAVKPDGSNLVVLAETFDNGARLLDSTADGQWVLMASQVKGTYLLKLDGRQESISLDSRPAYRGTWSPDGQRLLLVFQDGVVVTDTATGQGTALPLPLTFVFSDPNASPQPGFVEGASWSPDGSWVVAQQVGLSAEGQLVRGLYRYTLASTTLTTLAQNSASGMAGGPLVAPDGRTVLTSSPTTNSGLVSWPIAGGEPTSLVEMALPLIEPPQWSPDGTWLALIYADDVILLRADGSASRQLTFTAELAERQLAWSPDGQWLTGVAYRGERNPQLFRLDVATGAITWLAGQNPVLRGLGHHNPQWLVGTGTGESPWPAAATVPPLPDPGAPTPPVEMVLNPPPMSIDPPWWGNVFFYRRQINLPEALPLPTSPFAPPVLAQVSFSTSLIWEQLAFGEYQHDLRLAWWGGEVWGWRELGYEESGLDGEFLTLTFPLQAGPNGETGAYYLYYGAPGRLESSPPDLDELYLPTDPQDEDAFTFGYGLGISPWGDPEEIEATSGVVNWPIGWQNRPVLELAQPESQARGWATFSSSVQGGALQVWLRPQTNLTSGVILAATTEFPGDSSSSSVPQPFLTYDGQAFHLILGGQELVAPYALPATV